MSDKMRWRYADTNPVVSDVSSTTVIEIGDLVCLDGDETKPASEFTDLEEFKDKFLGVAMQRSRKGESGPIRVATTGVFEFDCDKGVMNLGGLITVRHNGLQLVPQAVELTKNRNIAIARVAKRKLHDCMSVYIDVCSTIMRGGI